MKTFALALCPLLVACGDDTSPATDALAERTSRRNDLYDDCEVDADCLSGQFCAIGFCTAQCIAPTGVREGDCAKSNACGSGCCLVFDAEGRDGACLPCADYFDSEGNVAGCDGSSPTPPPSLGVEGDSCSKHDDCEGALRCINGECSDGCTSDSQCRLSQICSHNECKNVECKYNSDCGSCSRCSDNTCRDCGHGPYGCYC